MVRDDPLAGRPDGASRSARMRSLLTLLGAALVLLPVPASLSGTEAGGLLSEASEDASLVDGSAITLISVERPRPVQAAELPTLQARKGSSPAPDSTSALGCRTSANSINSAGLSANACTSASSETQAQVEEHRLEVWERVQERLAKR